ncbi:hypothetical protein RRG08_043065 [Elysia crispata]|uniref:Uncharacterized protein n=1 Tax=Elysia crispata TaxID=231223 RepID=A0AAE1CPG6_9GAST|nr:hypothetical protein RRG08_043065 [Elysia crispata]
MSPKVMASEPDGTSRNSFKCTRGYALISGQVRVLSPSNINGLFLNRFKLKPAGPNIINAAEACIDVSRAAHARPSYDRNRPLA